MGNGKEVITVALQFDYESELDKLSNNLNKVLNKSGSEMTDKMRDGIKSLQSQIKELKASVESLRNAPSGASEYGKVIEGLQTQFKQLSIQVISLEKQFRDMGSSVAQSSEVKEITNTIGALDEAVKKTTSSVQSMNNSVNKTDGLTLKSELKETKQAAEETAKALDELSNKTTVYKNQTNTTTQRKGKTIKTLGWTEFTDFFQTVTKNAVIKNDGSLSITSEKVRTNYEALEKEITKIDSKIVQLQFDMGTQGEVARASTQRQLVMLREYLDLLEKTRNKQIGSPAYLPDSGNAQVIDTVRSQTLISKYNEQITKVSNSVDKLLNKVHELQSAPGISSDYADDLNKADGILKNLSTDLESLFNKIKAGNGSISDQDILQFFDSYSKGIISVEDILGFDKLSKKLDTTYQKIAKLRIELNTADPTSRSFIQQQISELEDFTQQIKQTQAALSTIAGANSSEMTSKAALTQYSQSLKKVQDNLVRLLDKVHELQETPSISSDYSNDLDDADKKIQKLQVSILTLWASIQRGQADENSIKAFFDAYGDESERIQKTIDFSKTDKQLADLKNELIEINSELAKATGFEDKNALEKKKEAIEEVINALTNERNLELGLSGTAVKTYNNSKASISQYNEEVIKTNDSLNKMREKIASLISDSSRSTSFKKELGLLDAEIASFQSNLVNAFNVLKSDPFNTTSINTFYDQLQNVVGILEKYNSTISNSTSSTAYSATREEVQKLDNRISAFLDQNSAAANRFKQQLLGIQSVLRDTLSNNGELTKLDLSSYSEQVNKIESEVKSLHQTGNSFFTSLRKQLQSANAQFIGTYFSIQDFIRYAKEIFDAVTEIDSALTELRKVSDATSARLVESFETSAEAARDLGASVKDVINETADWARLGYSVDEAEELAEVTTLFKNVGDNMSAETASEYMISALQGFQMAADDAEHIVDAYNEVANNFAIDTAGIGEALERSASSFTAANTSMEKAIALVTATNEVIQNPESVGTLWKTMSARLRGAATELAELGEEEDEFTKTTSKLRDLVMGLTGFDIMIDEDNFKDIYDIILGIGEKWDELTDIEQASLGEALAGKRNANAFYAVIGNLDTLKGAYEAASDSAGSAAKEQENFEKSIKYSLNRLSATLEVLATDFLSSDFAKGAVDFLTGIVELLDSIVNHIGVLIPLLSTLGGLAIIKNINNIKGLSDLGKSLALMSEAGKTIDTLKTAGASADAFAQGLKALTFEQTAAALAEKQINAALIEEILLKQGVGTQLAKETAARATLTAAQSAQVKSTFSLSAAYKGLAASVGLSAGAFTALLGVGALLGGLAYSIYEVLQESEKLAESARELGQEFSKTKSEIDDYKIRVEELNEIINNSENFEEVREAREQLLSIQKEMIDKYGDEAEKVIDLTNTLKDQTSAWNELSKAQWQQTKNAFNANKKWNPFDDWNRSLYDAESNLDLMLQKMENTSYTLEFEYDDVELAEKIQELYGLERGLSTPGTYGLAVTGNLYEVRQTFLEIQRLLETSDDVSDETLKNITESAQAIEDTFDSYSDIYNQYVFFERILDQNKPEYEDYYNAVKQAYSDFEKAYTEGDTLAQQNALKQIAERKNAIIDAMKETDGVIDAEEKSILVFVDSLMPLISDQLSSKQLELDIAVNADNIKESLEKAVETFDSVENIPDKLNILTGQELTEEQKAAWETLNESATEYGLTIQELIDLLAKLGVIEVDYNPDIPKELRDQVEAVNNRLDGNYLPAYQQYYKEANESLISSEDVHNANEYAKSLDSIYQKYNGIDNMNRDFIYWDDETLKKNEQFITEMFGSYEEGVEWLKDTWSTVLGGTAQEGEIQIAYTQLLQTPDGLLPLTEDVVWDYIDSIYSKAFDENGEFDVEKFIHLDSEGADVLINGQMQHIANLIAAAEGQYLNGIKLTADDVIAIGNPGYDENGNDLLPDIKSIFKGYSMHEVQEKTLLGRFNEFLKSLIPEFKPETLDEFFEEMQIDTEEEYQLWLDVASGCTSATEAMQKYRDAVAEVSNVDPFNYNSLSDAVSDIDKKLVPQFKELGELYDEIFNGDNGFDLSGIDTSDLKSVIDAFNDLDAALEIDPPTEAIEEFLHVIGNPSSTSDQVQKSFDAIATAYFNAAVEAGNFSEENAVVLEQMLTEMGIVNASDVVAHYEAVAAAQKLAADNGKNLAEMTALQIEEFAAEVGASDATADALYLLALKQIFLNENWINESDSIQQVLELAKAAGITADALDKLAQIQALQGAIDAEIATGNPTTRNLLDYNTRLEQLQANASEYADAVEQAIQEKLSVDIDFSVPKTGGSGGSSASDAGKDAADEYVKAFEEELKDLERLRDAGVISEKEFLERYKDLIEKYFKDVDGYADEYADRMKDYFDRLTTYYENIFSAISTVLSHRINALQDAKSAAVDAINAEKEAAAESYQTQIDYLDELIDAKEAEIDAIDDEIDRYQDQIDAIDKQIDALEEANQKRQQAINLQKAQYELEKAQNQRTKLIYKGGQLVYENDTSAVRDARENLEDAEFEIQKQKLEDLKKPLEEQIELLEKRKELIQDEIDGYQKQQDALQKALDASNKYYDSLIKETEAYWDSLIEKLEKTKSKFEEIAQLKELSEALALIKDFYGETEYTLEDVWNGVPGAIDYVLEKYKDALMGANSYNEDFAQALALAEQEITGSLGNISSSASDIESALGPVTSALVPIGDEAPNIESAATALGEAADNTAELATNSSTASSNTQSLATNLGDVASRSGDVAANTGDSATNIETIGTKAGEAYPKVEQLANANGELADNAGNVAENVGKAAEAISDEGTNAESAYTSLNNIANLNLATIVTQTKLLAEALSEVASALGLSEEATVSALETTITKLSQMSLGDEQTGIIGSFNALKAAVTGVTDAIGGGSGGDTSGGDGTTDKSQSMSADAEDGGSSGLIQAIADLHEAADTHIGTGSGEGGEEGGTVISDFDALKAAIDLVAETIGISSENGEVSETSLVGVIQALPELTEEPMTTVLGFFTSLQEAIASCAAAVEDLASKIKSLGGAAGGSLTLSLPGAATGNVHIGNAYANGKLGIKKSETALVGEVGQELVYNPATGTYRTVGDHGPEITRLNKGDLIFNAKQTEAIIKNGKRDHGRSYADGNAGFMPLTDEEMSLFTKIGSAVADMQMDIRQMLDPVRSMAQNVTRNTTNIAPVININDTKFEVSGVTGEEVTRQISDTFSGIISNAYQRAMKR